MTPADLDALLREGRATGLFHHASLCVLSLDGRRLDAHATPPGPTPLVFDVASVTKVATAVLCHRLLAPDRKLPWIRSSPTVTELLAHASGLPAWRPLFAHVASSLRLSPAELVRRPDLHAPVRRRYRDLIATTDCTAPRPTYSDLGFLALGFELESATGLPLDRLLRDAFGAIPGLEGWGGSFSRAVSTGPGRPRPWVPAVEVDAVGAVSADVKAIDDGPDDDNAACAGGTTGHAGLRATAEGIATLGLFLLRDTQQSGEVVTQQSARALFTKVAGTRTAGLDTPSGDAPAIGTLLGRGPLGAAGHLGFTGCSLWMDRDTGLSIALLSDAVTCERPAARFKAFRPRVHDAVAHWAHVG